MIHNELKNLIDPKYKRIKKEVEDLLRDEDIAFKLNAQQIQEFVTTSERALGCKIVFDDKLELMDTPNIQSCFKLLSKYIESEFNLGQILDSLENSVEDAGSVDTLEKPKQD